MAEKTSIETMREVVEQKKPLRDKLIELRDSVRGDTAWYQNSSVLISTQGMSLGLRETLLAATMAGLNILLAGDTGAGKTDISRGFQNSIFGKEGVNWDYICAHPHMTPEHLSNVNFGVIKEGGLLSDAVNPGAFITGAAGTIDEYNRAPEQLLAFLHDMLAYGSVTFQGGVKVPTGVVLPDGTRFRSTIVIMNKGMDYSGTFSTDKATMDRFHVVIPTRIIRPTYEDQMNILSNNNPAKVENEVDRSAILFDLNKAVRSIDATGQAKLFLSYLTMKDQCYKSPGGIKPEFFNPEETCEGCHAGPLHLETCGYVGAISVRTMKAALNFASSLALYRYLIGGENEQGVGKPQVELADVLAAVPMTLFMKVPIHPQWMGDHAEGDPWYGTQLAITELAERYKESFARISGLLDKDMRLTGPNGTQVTDAVMKDPACVPVETVQEYRLALPKKRD